MEIEQADWKHMYLELAKTVADVIDLMPKTQENEIIKQILICAMRNAEEIYVQGGEEGGC